MLTYLLNKDAYAFKISSDVTDLDIEKMKSGGVVFFSDEEKFMQEWSRQTGIDREELECSEYLIAKNEEGKTVVVCDRGFIMDHDENDVETFVIDYVM